MEFWSVIDKETRGFIFLLNNSNLSKPTGNSFARGLKSQGGKCFCSHPSSFLLLLGRCFLLHFSRMSMRPLFRKYGKNGRVLLLKKAFVSLERGREGERTDPPMKRRKKPFLNLKWCYFFQPSTQLPGKSKRAYILDLMAAAVASPLFRCLNFTLCKKYPTRRR